MWLGDLIRAQFRHFRREAPRGRYFHYDDTGLLAEYDASGARINEYQYKPGSTWMTHPLFKRDAAGKVHYYYTSHLGQPLKLFDRTGKMTWEGRSQAFGQTTVVIEETENNLRFPGQYADQETGLYYNFMRYYAPQVGRYFQVDSIGLEGGINIYLYTLASPLTHIDPVGEEPAMGDAYNSHLSRGGWNNYQKSRSGDGSSVTQRADDYRRAQINSYGRTNSGRASPADVASGINNAGASICAARWGKVKADIDRQIEQYIASTDECFFVYWQIDYYIGPIANGFPGRAEGGCASNFSLAIGLSDSVYHEIAYPHEETNFFQRGGFWTYDRGKARGEKPARECCP